MCFLPTSGQACTNPAGNPGDTIYNDDYAVLQYCDTTNWIAMSGEDTGLIAHLKLDETAGTTAFDSSPEGNDFTVDLGTPDWGARGVLGDSMIDADFENLTMTGLSASAVTVATWVYVTTDANFNDAFQINWNFGTGGYAMYSENSGNIVWGVMDGGVQRTTADIGGTTLNEWQHWVGVYDGTDVILYVNGVEENRGNFPGISLSTSGAFYVADDNGNIRFDDARVYDRALSAAEIDALYDMGRDRSLDGHWKLDETAGFTAVDNSVNGNNGAMVNGLSGADSVAGKVDTALNFDGSRVLPGTLSGVDLSNNSYTLAIWARKESDGGIQQLLDFGSGFAIGDKINFGFKFNNSFTCNHNDGNASYEFGNYAGDFDWHHWACTYNAATNLITVYQNGVSIGTAPELDDFTGSMLFSIGGRNIVNGWNFYGDIDDARIYDRVLSAEEIKSLVERWTPGCSNPLGPEGAAIYNDDDSVMQFCNDDGWQGMGPNGDGGAGCTNPTGAAGDMIYNDDFDVMQFCEGDDWVAIGK